MDGVLLCDGAVVIPVTLRRAVLDILGSARQGIQAMGDRAAGTIFWPSIKEDLYRRINPRQALLQPQLGKGKVAGRPGEPEPGSPSYSDPKLPAIETLMAREKGMVSTHPSVDSEGRDRSRTNDPNDLEDPLDVTQRTKPPRVPIQTVIQMQATQRSLDGDGVEGPSKAVPGSHCTVRTRGLDRTPRRVCDFLWKGAPKEESPRSPKGRDTSTRRGVDSAWGARGHMSQSAYSSDSPGESCANRGAETRDSRRPKRQLRNGAV